MTRTTTLAQDSFLYLQLRPGLESLARRLGADDPESTASQVLFDCLLRRERLDLDDNAFRAYAYRALRNRVNAEHRSPVPVLVGLDEVRHDRSEPDHLERLVGDEKLRAMLGSLPPAQRDVVAHRFVGGYSAAETARRLGRSPGAVRRLQHDAIRRIRFLLAAGTVLAVLAFMVNAADRAGVTVDNTPATRTPAPTTAPTAPPSTASTTATTPAPDPEPSITASGAATTTTSTATTSPEQVATTMRPASQQQSSTPATPTTTAGPLPPPPPSTAASPTSGGPGPAPTPVATLPPPVAGAASTIPESNVTVSTTTPQPSSSWSQHWPESDGTPRWSWRQWSEGDDGATSVPEPEAMSLVAAHSGLCLDVEDGNDATGARLIQWVCHGGANQQFAWTGTSLTAAHSGLCLGVADGSRQPGAHVVQGPCTGDPHQTLERVGDEMVFAHTGQCLDVVRASERAGARLIQWPCHGGANQQFTASSTD